MEINDIFPEGLSIDVALKLLGPVAVYILGVAVYALFIFKFYRFVSARDMFELDLSKYEAARLRWVRTFLHFVFYVAKYLILFPIFAFFWFAVLTIILAFLSKNQAFPQVLLVALATVGAIRATSYYSEDLSRDLAKILPFAVLGIFLIDAEFFRIEDSLEILKEASDHRETILYYLLFLIAMEFALRLVMAVVTVIAAARRSVMQEPAPAEEVEPSSPAEETEEPTWQEEAPQEEAPQDDDATWSEATEDAPDERAPNNDE